MPVNGEFPMPELILSFCAQYLDDWLCVVEPLYRGIVSRVWLKNVLKLVRNGRKLL